MDELEKNINHFENTFIYQLHENFLYNSILLDKLIRSICQNIKDNLISSSARFELLKKVLPIYMSFNDALICHFDPNDLFEIRDLDENYYIYHERFIFIIEVILKKDYKSIEKYMDDLGKMIPGARPEIG